MVFCNKFLNIIRLYKVIGIIKINLLNCNLVGSYCVSIIWNLLCNLVVISDDFYVLYIIFIIE